ncbi:hypothetical protein [Kitasatospora sp. NBC_00315]|uniref:hypothetical protein n=1 Tax=Kitasatospora sp. NBC_00315 TaxID=2975963 RepID=UPI003253E9EB
MATGSGDRHSVRIGGDAHGPVVVGRDNRVEATSAPRDNADGPSPDAAATPSGDAQGPPSGTSTQNNTAGGHGTLYAVMKGDLHVHHEEDGEDR